MAVDDRLSDLLVEWEQGRRSGQEPSLEDLCRDTPELLPVVRESIDSLRATDWMFRAEPTGSLPSEAAAAGSAALHDTELPASHLTAEEFAASIFQSGLLSRDEIEDLKKRLDASALPGEAREIASRLVTEGKLTRYQAAVLLKASKDPLLVDNYVILDTLDTGGMGLVFKALHRSMNRVVALKLLPASMMSARDTVKRFQREVQAAAALKHPNIVAAYDADESDEIAYLVLEYVDGTNLFRLVKEQGPRTLAQAADYVRQAACGLAYLHSRGIIHRDVKPANLILAKDGTVKLLDMGLVRFASSEDLSCAGMDQELTQAGIVIGTVAYMSPEQALDTRSADQRSDIYSLGCTLFFLLTGRSLYHEETGMKTLLAHREQAVPSLRKFCEEAPVSLDAVFRTMVAKRPADRLQTMEEVIAAIDACVPVPAAAGNFSTPIVPDRPGLLTSKRRHRAWRSGRFRIATALVALAAALVGSVYFAGFLIRIRAGHSTTEVSVTDPNATIEIHSLPEARPEDNHPNESAKPTGLGTDRAMSQAKGAPPQSGGPAVRGGSIKALELKSHTGHFARATTQSSQLSSAQLLPEQLLAKSEHETSDDRAVADWVVAHRGSFTIDGKEELSYVPDREFHVGAVRLQDPPDSPRAPFGISQAFIEHLAKLTDLQRLFFDCAGLNDSHLEAIHKLKNLTSLAVRRASITDGGLRWLEGLSRLSSLDLRETEITDNGLKELAKIRLFAASQLDGPAKPWMPRTQPTLLLDGTHTTEAGIIAFQRSVPNCSIFAAHLNGPYQNSNTAPPFPPATGSSDAVWAEWLFSRLNDCRMRTDVDPETWVAAASSLPPIDFHITQIEFGNQFSMRQRMQQSAPGALTEIRLSSLVLRHLGDLPRLEGLSFQHANEDWFPAVATLGRLKSLTVEAGVGDDALKAIGNMTNLTRLRIAGDRLTDRSLKELARLTELNRLEITRARYVHGAGFKDLSGLKKIKFLNLADSAIDDDGLRDVGGLSSVEILELKGTWITPKGLVALARLPNLRALDLSNCRRIDDTAFASLKEVKSLRELWVGNSRIPSDAAAEFQGVLLNCRILWNVDMAAGLLNQAARLPSFNFGEQPKPESVYGKTRTKSPSRLVEKRKAAAPKK